MGISQTIGKHWPHVKQRTIALKFPKLQIVIIAKAPPKELFCLRVTLEKSRFKLIHYARNLASVKTFEQVIHGKKNLVSDYKTHTIASVKRKKIRNAQRHIRTHL